MTDPSLLAEKSGTEWATSDENGLMMKGALAEALDRYLITHHGGKREEVRVLIRAVQRFMESRRQFIKQTAHRMISDAEARYNERTKADRIWRAGRISDANTKHMAELEAIETEYRQRVGPLKASLDRSITWLRDQVSHRMAEADEITKATIHTIKLHAKEHGHAPEYELGETRHGPGIER